MPKETKSTSPKMRIAGIAIVAVLGIAVSMFLTSCMSSENSGIPIASEEGRLSLSAADEIIAAHEIVQEFRRNSYTAASGFEEEVYKLQTQRRQLVADYQESSDLFSNGATIDKTITVSELEKAKVTVDKYRGAIMLFRQHHGNWGGEATAFRISEDLVLTNAHNLSAESGDVPEGLTFTLTDINGEEHAATFLGAEFGADLALMRLEKPLDALPYFDMDNWATRHEGNKIVIAIGHPGRIGFWTPTIGRSENGIQDLSDLEGEKAAVAAQAKMGATEGSSGSPIFDIEGNLLGILFGSQSGFVERDASAGTLSSYFYAEGIAIYSLAYDFKRKVLAWAK